MDCSKKGQYRVSTVSRFPLPGVCRSLVVLVVLVVGRFGGWVFWPRRQGGAIGGDNDVLGWGYLWT